jgi:hypothetical protein
MDKELLAFRDNVDSWVKKINSDMGRMKQFTTVIEETSGNIEHNYEIIRELQHEMDDVKKEVKLLRTIQLMFLKKYNEEKV